MGTAKLWLFVCLNFTKTGSEFAVKTLKFFDEICFVVDVN